jgi:hypothetical protein
MPKCTSGAQRIGDVLQRDIAWVKEDSGTTIVVGTGLKSEIYQRGIDG